MISSLSECLSFWPTDFRHVYLTDFLTISMSVYLSEYLCVRLLLLLSWHCFLTVLDCRVSFFFFFSYQKPTDFNRKRLNLYTQKPLYLHLTLNVLDDWYQTIDSMRVSPYYYPTAQSRVHLAILYGHLDSWLFCTVKRRFSIHFAFPAIYEMSRKTWHKKKPLNNK